MFRCGLWASSGPFPLLARYRLYKRGRDPPTNPSHHLKKERSDLPLKWLLKEDQGRRPTAASAAATAAALLRAATVPATVTAASPCLDHMYPGHTSLRRRRRRISMPPSFPLHGPHSPPPLPSFPLPRHPYLHCPAAFFP